MSEFIIVPEPIVVSPATVLELTQRLRQLRDWEPVGAFLETARMALAGEEGLTAREVARMRRWAIRWEQLHPRLREFYVVHTSAHVGPSADAHAALLAVLDGGEPFTGARYGRLKDLWLMWACTTAPFELAPVSRR